MIDATNNEKGGHQVIDECLFSVTMSCGSIYICVGGKQRGYFSKASRQMELKIISQQEDKTSEIFASEDCRQLLSMYEDFYPKTGFNIPWVGYFVIRQNKIVGSCSFIGNPKDGHIEIAYWTFKEFEGQGIASFACKELITICYKTDPSLTITAKTAPENNASTKILENNGFVFFEIVQDEEIGDAWLWKLKKKVDKT